MGRVIAGGDEDLIWRTNRIQQAQRQGAGMPDGAMKGVALRALGGGFGRGSMFRGGHEPKAYLGALAGKNEAFIKIIGRGGCHSGKELRTQVEYVSREDEVQVFGADCFGMDKPLSPEEIEETISFWEDGWTSSSKNGHTMHMIVSFPIGTEADAALSAGKAFAETAFGSGDYGDTWDYMAALHTDKEHPHVHLVINRSGMQHGKHLQTYKTNALNLDHMRMLQVEAGAKHGIEMTATSRLSRGIMEQCPSTREYRHAMKAGMPALGKTRSGASLQYAEKVIATHQEAYRNLGEAFQDLGEKRIAHLMEEASQMLGKGEKVMATLDEAELPKFETLEKARGVILSEIEKRDSKVRFLSDAPDRQARLERKLGAVKGEALMLAPERADFAAHAQAAMGNAYRSDGVRGLEDGLKSERWKGVEGMTVKRLHEEALEATKADAKSIGVDPEKFVARYKAGGALDLGTEAKWAAEDISSAMKHSSLDPKTMTPRDQREIASRVDQLHERTGERFKSLAEDMGLDLNKPDQSKGVQQINEAAQQLTSAQLGNATKAEIAAARKGLAASVDQTLTPEQKGRLRTEGEAVLGELGVAPSTAAKASREFNRAEKAALALKQQTQQKQVQMQQRKSIVQSLKKRGNEPDFGL